jgi:hypothetical protein
MRYKHTISPDQLSYNLDTPTPAEADPSADFSTDETPEVDALMKDDELDRLANIGSYREGRRLLGLPLDPMDTEKVETGRAEPNQIDQESQDIEYPHVRLEERAKNLLVALTEYEKAESLRGLRESGKRPGMSSNSEIKHAQGGRDNFIEAYGLKQVQKVLDGPDSDLEEITARHFANGFQEKYAGPGRDKEKARRAIRKMLKRYIKEPEPDEEK